MPVYEFKCRDCLRSTDLSTRVSGGESCPDCGGGLVRVWHANVSSVPGLARDRFKYRDKIAANRQRVHDQERGVP